MIPSSFFRHGVDKPISTASCSDSADGSAEFCVSRSYFLHSSSHSRVLVLSVEEISTGVISSVDSATNVLHISPFSATSKLSRLILVVTSPLKWLHSSVHSSISSVGGVWSEGISILSLISGLSGAFCRRGSLVWKRGVHSSCHSFTWEVLELGVLISIMDVFVELWCFLVIDVLFGFIVEFERLSAVIVEQRLEAMIYRK